MTIHAAAGSLTIEAEVNGQPQPLVVRRTFGDGACASTLKVFGLVAPTEMPTRGLRIDSLPPQPSPLERLAERPVRLRGAT